MSHYSCTLHCLRQDEQIKCRQWRCDCKGLVACGISFRWLTWKWPGLWVSHCHLCLVIESCQFFFIILISGNCHAFMATLTHCFVCVGKLPCFFFCIFFSTLTIFDLNYIFYLQKFELLTVCISHNYWFGKGVSHHYSDKMPIHIHYGQITSTHGKNSQVSSSYLCL